MGGLPTWVLGCGCSQKELLCGHARPSRSPRRSLRAGADVQCIFCKKKKKIKKRFFLFILKALLRSAIGFASGGGSNVTAAALSHSQRFRGLKEKMASTLSNTSHLQRPWPECVFPPVDNWAVMSVKRPLTFLAFIGKAAARSSPALAGGGATFLFSFLGDSLQTANVSCRASASTGGQRAGSNISILSWNRPEQCSGVCASVCASVCVCPSPPV